MKTFTIKTIHTEETTTGNLAYSLEKLSDKKIIETKETVEYGETVCLIKYEQETIHEQTADNLDDAIKTIRSMYSGNRVGFKVVTSTEKEEIVSKKEKKIIDAEELLFEMDANNVDEIDTIEGFGERKTYTRSEVESAVFCTGEFEMTDYRFDDAYEKVFVYDQTSYIFCGTYSAFGIDSKMSDSEKTEIVNNDSCWEEEAKIIEEENSQLDWD